MWAARFYKTRSLAAQAIGGGHVQLNGGRPKPSRPIKPGDRLRITREGYRYDITVLGLSERRGPAREAQLLYEESPDSIAAREALREQHRLAAASTPHPGRRPDKKARRQLRGLKG
ncbi:MAG TPA: RNA-binding protein [Gammaproteobacteria bacterium]|nr:RNA-binding protein [Gammaproteobacteria bacterium]